MAFRMAGGFAVKPTALCAGEGFRKLSNRPANFSAAVNAGKHDNQLSG